MSSQKSKRIEAEGWSLPEIPDKLYFTIGEVGRLCQLKPHVLRYWEQEFSQLKPTKRRGNRRYYQRKDVELIVLIKTLLYKEGYTIDGARQRILAERKKSTEVISEPPMPTSEPVVSSSRSIEADVVTPAASKENLESAVADLEKLLGVLETTE
jgi:DNA-binding transcriptional MerR regulator